MAAPRFENESIESLQKRFEQLHVKYIYESTNRRDASETLETVQNVYHELRRREMEQNAKADGELERSRLRVALCKQALWSFGVVWSVYWLGWVFGLLVALVLEAWQYHRIYEVRGRRLPLGNGFKVDLRRRDDDGSATSDDE